jgi:hypothetical protein
VNANNSATFRALFGVEIHENHKFKKLISKKAIILMESGFPMLARFYENARKRITQLKSMTEPEADIFQRNRISVEVKWAMVLWEQLDFP